MVDLGIELKDSVIYISTANQLAELCNKLKCSCRPLLVDHRTALICTEIYMNKLCDGWCYFKRDDILIIADVRDKLKSVFYCVDLSIVNLSFMYDILACTLYGKNRRYALSNAVDTVKTEVLSLSGSVKELDERAKKIKEIADNLRFLYVFDGYYAVGTHVIHNGESCSCMVLLKIEDDSEGFKYAYCNYICIPDTILSDVINITSEKSSGGIN